MLEISIGNTTVIKYLFIYLGLIFFSNLVGHSYFRFCLGRKYFLKKHNYILSFSEQFLIGLTIIISSIAVLKTSGQSVFSLLVLLLTLLPFFCKKGETESAYYYNKNNLKNQITSSLMLIGLMICFYLLHNCVYSHLGDHVFYSKLSVSMIDSGVENYWSLYDDYSSVEGIALYHYFDLWLAGFISKVFLLNELYSLIHLVYPIFHFLSFIILMGIINEKDKSYIRSFIIAVAVMYGSAILFTPLLSAKEGHHTFWFYGLPDITSFKSLVVYPFIFLAFYYLKYGHRLGFVVMLSMCLLVYSPLLIAISGGFCLYVLFMALSPKFKLYRIPFVNILLFFLVLVGLLLLTHFTKRNMGTNGEIGFIHYIHPIKYYGVNFFKYLNTFNNYFFRMFYLYPISIGAIIILHYNRNSAIRSVFLFVLFAIFSASIFIALFENIKDSTQALSIYLPSSMIFIALIVVENTKGLYKTLLVILLLISVGLNFNTLINSEDSKLIELKEKSEEELSFENKLIYFGENVLKDSKWAYLSERHWTSWLYNTNICENPILKVKSSVLPIEIAPFIGNDITKYRLKNQTYPLNEEINDMDEKVKVLCLFFEKMSIKYIYIEDYTLLDERLLAIIRPLHVYGKKGVWVLE